MKKMLLKEIKNAVITGVAINCTKHGLTEYKELKAKEGYFDKVGYSIGVNGVSGCLFKGVNSGQLYAVTARSSALFIYL